MTIVEDNPILAILTINLRPHNITIWTFESIFALTFVSSREIDTAEISSAIVKVAYAFIYIMTINFFELKPNFDFKISTNFNRRPTLGSSQSATKIYENTPL